MSHNIDKIFYINLDFRQDRKAELESEIEKMGLTEKLERFSAFNMPGKQSVGCGMSHIAVLKMARERGYKNVLILEDDFMFVVDKTTLENSLTNLFDNVDFDVCMCSYLLNNSEASEWPFLKKVLAAQTTAGYIIHHTFYDKLIDLYEWAMPILDNTGEHWIYAVDQIWKRLQPESKWYCFTDRIGKQRPGYSDISCKYADYDC